jgi:hypothetical protein
MLSARSRKMIKENANLGGREIDPDASQFIEFIAWDRVVARTNKKLPLTDLQKACLDYVSKPSLRTQEKLASVRARIIKAYTRGRRTK